MSKALFISSGDAAASEIASGLAIKHKIKKIGASIDDFLVEVDKERPEVIIIVMGDKFDGILIYMFMLECPDTPMVILGTEAQEAALKSEGYLPAEWARFVYTPAKASEIMQKMDGLLNRKKRLGASAEKQQEAAAPTAPEVGKKPPVDTIPYKRFTGTGKPHVMLIDDNPTLIRAMQKTLSQKYEVSFATSGKQALANMTQNVPDIILLDYEMPEMDGLETLRNIRSNERTKTIPVIFLTGLADFEHVFGAVEMRPQGYLLKTCTEKRLFSEINTVLGIKY